MKAAGGMPMRLLQQAFRSTLSLALLIVFLVGTAAWLLHRKDLARPEVPLLSIRRADTVAANGYSRKELRDRGTSIYVGPQDEVTEKDVERAVLEDYRDLGGPIALRLTFTPAGREKLEKLSAQHMGRPLAILLNGQVVSAPVVRTKLPGPGGVTIQGNFSQAQIEAVVRAIAAASP